jgi:hypothetical protein
MQVIGDANSPRRLGVALVEGRQSVNALHQGWRPTPAAYGWTGSAT